MQRRNYPLIDDCIKEYRLHKDGYWYDVRNENQRWDTCFEAFHDYDSDEQEWYLIEEEEYTEYIMPY